MTPTEGFLHGRDGRRLYYRIDGRGRNLVVAPLACWLAEDLADLGGPWTLVTFDPCGRGRSDALPVSHEPDLETDLADLEDVWDGLGLTRAALLGWAYHAGVIAHFAARHPGRVRQLLLVAPWPLRRDPHMAAACAAFAGRLDHDGLAWLERLDADGAPSTHPQAYARAWHRVHAPAHMANVEALARMRSDPFALPNEWARPLGLLGERRRRALGAWDWRPAVRALTVPALVVHGLADAIPVDAAREWNACGRDGRLILLGGSGHYPWIECPETFAAIATLVGR
jgi:proline iminopeptidase